jgi:hypothetical protein
VLGELPLIVQVREPSPLETVIELTERNVRVPSRYAYSPDVPESPVVVVDVAVVVVVVVVVLVAAGALCESE